MLRRIVLGFGAALMLAGLVLIFAKAGPGGAVCLIWGAVIVGGILFERHVYKRVAEAAPVGPGWSRTDERFVEEKTGRTITVYSNARTGERAYVAESRPETT